MSWILNIIKQIAGMPDYDRYIAHQRDHHPGESVLGEREFYERYVESRYGGAGNRCC